MTKVSKSFYVAMNVHGWRPADSKPLEVLGVVVIQESNGRGMFRPFFVLKDLTVEDAGVIYRPMEPVKGDPDPGYSLVSEEYVLRGELPPTQSLTAREAAILLTTYRYSPTVSARQGAAA